jgi:hypothetical protein
MKYLTRAKELSSRPERSVVEGPAVSRLVPPSQPTDRYVFEAVAGALTAVSF